MTGPEATLRDELIQQVWVIDAVSQTDQVCDVLIQRGRITAIAPSLSEVPPDVTVLEGRGKLLIPGLVDLYSHSGEPGFESRETLKSLLLSAQAGGFTRVGLLPTTDPPVDSPALVNKVRMGRNGLAQSLPDATLPQLYPWGCLTRGARGEQMAELADLAEADVVGFADDQPIQNPLLVQRLLQYLQPVDKPVALWGCDRILQDAGVAREGPYSLVYGLMGDPAISETAALAALLEAVAITGTPVHFMRLSTARGVTLIRQGKAQGLPITASTTWMHLLFNTQDLSRYDPNLRLDPPLGNPADQMALIEGVKTGVVDAIAVDHTPHTYEDKTVGFPSAPPGAIGLQLAWPILWDRFVAQGDWSPLTLVRALSTNPAVIWGQPPAVVGIDQPAEMALFDPEISWQVSPETLQSLSANTPWLGKTLKGQFAKTWMPQG